MTETPKTAAVVVEYLKKEFHGSEVPNTPDYSAGPDVHTFCVIDSGRTYRLEVTDECLSDLSDSELARHLRASRAAQRMLSSVTRTATLTKSGIAWNNGA